METRGFLMRIPVDDSVSTLEELEEEEEEVAEEDEAEEEDAGLDAGAARVFLDGVGCDEGVG